MNTLNPAEETLYHTARQIRDPQEQAAYLGRACAGDAVLRQRVEGLLRAGPAADEFFARQAFELPRPAPDPAAAVPVSEGPGTVIDRYKLLQQIGEGGMGVVYMAEQQEPLRRRVALKIIKLGMDTMEVVARFETERQALALMDHPNIARVFDGGATASGRPYFVMELVQGVPITEYCDKAKLATGARLKLFAQVAQAIQHAHQKGVIHRDIKPSNILVTLHDGVPVPKVIDFGVAKATHQKLTEKTLFTRFATMIGTPAYMSPEQAEMSGLDVDTRTDIYALGVLLYALLTGTTPFPEKRLRSLAYGEMQRVLLEELPERPSLRLGTMTREQKSVVARNCGEDASRLGQRLKGDLDWVVMKCLEKDRARRYETASALAADIQRHLRQEPVSAAAPSAWYVLGRYARRHRSALAAAATIVFLLVTGTVASTWQAVRATRAEQRATAESVTAVAERDRAQAEKQRADAEAARANRLVYFEQINLAQHAWELGDASRTNELLNLSIPSAGRADLRGFEWYFLDHLTHQDQELLKLANPANPDAKTGTGDPGVVYSGDGQLMASVSADGVVKIWDASTGKALASIAGGNDEVMFSPDSKRLIAASAERVGLWDARTGREVWTWRPKQGVELVVVNTSPDGRRVAIGSADGEITMVDAADGRELSSVRAHSGPISGIAYRADGKRMATASRDGTTRVWDADAMLEIFKLGGHPGWVTRLAFSPDGHRLFSAARDSIKVWDADSGEEKPSLPFESRLQDFTLSRDGGQIAAIGGGLVRIWNPANGQQKSSFNVAVKGLYNVAFSPDGSRLAVATQEPTGGAVRLWDTVTGLESGVIHGHTDTVMAVAFSPDGKRLASASYDETVRVWDAAASSGSLTLQGHTGAVLGIAFSPDGKELASASRDRTAIIWDAAAGRKTFTYAGHVGSDVRSVAFSPDGRQIATGGGTMRVWDPATGRDQFVKSQDGNTFMSTSFSPDGRLLAGSGKENDRAVVAVWDAATGAKKVTLGGQGLAGEILGVAFSPDSSRLASASRDGTAKIWDLASGTELMTLTGHTNEIRSVVFSPDGKRLATSSADGTLKLWDAAKGRVLLDLKVDIGPRTSVTSVTFSPDGRRLISAHRDLAIRVWDTETGQQVLSFPSGHTSIINAVVFSPDGLKLATASDDKTVKIWTVAASTQPAAPTSVSPAATAAPVQKAGHTVDEIIQPDNGVLDKTFGLSFKLPLGWSVARFEQNNSQSTIRLAATNALVTTAMVNYTRETTKEFPVGSGIGVRPTNPADLEGWLRGIARYNSNAYLEAHPDYRLRPESITPRNLAGQRAAGWLADFTSEGKKYTDYIVLISAEKVRVRFQFQAAAADFESLRPVFDALIESVGLQSATGAPAATK